MDDKFQNCKEIFKDHELTIEFENENLRSYLCKKKNSSNYWYRVIFAPLLITINGDTGAFVLTPNSYDSFKWFSNISKNDMYYIMTKIPSELRYSFFELSRNKVLEHLNDLQKKYSKLLLQKKLNFVQRFISDLYSMTDDEIYRKFMKLKGHSDNIPDFKDYSHQSYVGVAALFKFDDLYQEKIKLDKDKFMFENFMTPAIAEYKNELI
ncbi:MAG: hypothetical protein K2X69_08950 [Silvanigrellaceae bacterium]|nr:hypothetical protein [Silvanigrellaceae bacterium]